MPPWTLIAGAGAVVGLLYGLFGVGSAFATPVLAMIGIPPLAAVVGPLPALLPGSAAGAWSYARGGRADGQLARRILAGALPAAVAGAVVSRFVGGPALLVLSGLVLLLVGSRIVGRGRPAIAGAAGLRERTAFLVVAGAAIGFLSGLMANGGGFLLVPFFLVVLGLEMTEAAGTGLLIAVALTVPTLVTHIALGDVQWGVALAFAVGLVPGTFTGGRLAQRVEGPGLRRAFGVVLIGFAAWFLLRQLL